MLTHRPAIIVVATLLGTLLAACKNDTPSPSNPAQPPVADSGTASPSAADTAATASETAAVTATPSAARPQPASFEGTYQLTIDQDASWHEHSIIITKAAKQLRGIAIIDQGIGPQARQPDPDEISHVVSFVPVIKPEEPWRLKVELTLGSMILRIYSFDLLSCPAAGDRCQGDAAIQGTVTIDGRQPRKVDGTRVDPSQQPKAIPPWDKLPRGDIPRGAAIRDAAEFG